MNLIKVSLQLLFTLTMGAIIFFAGYIFGYWHGAEDTTFNIQQKIEKIIKDHPTD